MKISYKWVQNYFDEKLPAPDKLAERITFSFAEVESVERKGDDTILDVKVLPDRACYALSHRGVAYEVAASIGLKMKTIEWPQPEIKRVRLFSVRVEAQEFVLRYMARVVEKVTPKTQAWVEEHLEAVGQRSINPIVDGANIVMFDRGQPLHVFDADKVRGGIVVRMARKGEKIMMLDNREVSLDESILVIADEEAPLAIAGIKGGKKAEVTPTTKNLILESANFDASYIRKASERLNIKTDASKRFENKCSPTLIGKGISDFTAYLFEMDKNIVAGESIDWYPVPVTEKKISITPEYISGKLGMAITPEDIEKNLLKLLISVEKHGDAWTLAIPDFRSDLNIREDVVEEVGRLYGYEKIPAILPPKIGEQTSINNNFYYVNKIKTILVSYGFSEIYTSSFDAKGDLEVLYPVASDKNFLRTDLSSAMKQSLEKNLINGDLLGLTQIKLFEIGKVFGKGSEINSLCVGIANTKNVKIKINDLIRDTRENLIRELGADVQTVCTVDDSGGHLILDGEKIGIINAIDGVLEVNIDELIRGLPEPKNFDIHLPSLPRTQYNAFSKYPFVVRDIAVFVPLDVQAQSVLTIIENEAGSLVVNSNLFDEFKKDGKISYAFRLVFQSFERTLTDDEVNKIMEKITPAISANGWLVR